MSYVSRNTTRKSRFGRNRSRNGSRSNLPGWIGWIAGVLVAAVVLVAALLSTGYWSFGVRATPGHSQMAPMLGGMILDSTGGGPVRSDSVATAAGTATPVYRPGSHVVSRIANMPIYADVGADSLLLHSFGSGSMFTVLEPNGDYGNYPVPKGELLWIRVRAADGLVGWTPIESVVPYP